MSGKFKNKLHGMLLSALMAISTISPTTIVKAEEVNIIPSQEKIEDETPKQTEAPVESLLPTSTPNSDDDSQDYVEIIEPVESSEPNNEGEDIQEDINDEESNIEFVNELNQVISVKDFQSYIESGLNGIYLMGSVSDRIFMQMHNAYFEIAKGRGIDTFVNSIDIDVMNQEDLDLLLTYTYRAEDQKALKDAFNGNGGAILFTYNKNISNVITHKELNDEYTPFEIASKEITANYIMPDYDMDDRALFSVDEGKQWFFRAKGQIQEFTAPMNGYYEVMLRGADGDSDTGGFTQGVNASTIPHTTGVGGGGATATGTIYLEKGQTVYLALGFRNGMSHKPSYNGGGTGYGQSHSFRSGGGGAASLYLSNEGDGQLANYIDKKDQVLMVAGGGGGAEDFYATGLDWNAPYYCLYNACSTSYGGNGGTAGLQGSGTGPNGITGGYSFGVGEAYGSYENASAGAGGGGWYGGTSPDDDSKILRGGTGGGGSSYANEAYMKDVSLQDGKNVNFYWNEKDGWDDGQHASATITLKSYQSYPLLIHYVSKITGEPVAADYNGTFKYGDKYEVISPEVEGFTIMDEEYEVVDGVMPDEPVEITVYYNYPGIRVHYLDHETNKPVADMVYECLKTGTPYSYTSPQVDDYVFYNEDDLSKVVKGTKTSENEEYIIYYAKAFSPDKHIVDVNGHAITQEHSDKGVELKDGDIVTYELRYHNYRGIAVDEVITDVLPATLQYIHDETNSHQPTVNGQTLTWNLHIEPESGGTIRFKAKVVNQENINEVINWTRKDPLVKFDVTKTANVENDGYVGYNQEVEYNLIVKNNGIHSIHNIKVVDSIPEHTEYVTHIKTHKGTYDDSLNRVSWHIEELKPNEVIALTFTVRVIEQIIDDSQIDIINQAFYANDLNKDLTFDQVITEGTPTNEIIHHIVGPKIDAVKSANPENMSHVNAGELIRYRIELQNNGTVKSNFIRVTDIIPEGTTYVPNSLIFVSDNNEANNKLAVSHGDAFDVNYDFNTKQYYLSNVDDIDVKTKQVQYKVTYTQDDWVKKTGNIGGYISGANGGNPSLYYDNKYQRDANFGRTVRNVKGSFASHGWKYDNGKKDPEAKSCIDEAFFKTPTRGQWFNKDQWVNFETDNTPIRSMKLFIYTGDIEIKPGTFVADEYQLDIEWKTTEYEELTTTTKTTDWQNDQSIPEGATFVSAEERVVDSYVKSISFELPNGVSVDKDSLPSGWSVDANGMDLNFTGEVNSETVKTLLQSVRFNGEYGTTGSIKFNLKSTNETDFTSTTQSGEFIVPATGIYKLEAWGADGGSAYTTGGGGAGGYVVGEIKLNKDDKIYSVTGGRGWGNMGWEAGSIEARRAYNGGGVQETEGAGGGGATHFATTNRGVLKNYNSYRDEVLLVAGGGGGRFSGGGGNSGGGGAGFGQGSDSCYRAGGGGGWSGGGCDGRGGTNYINTNKMTNTSQQNGVSRGGSIKITLLDYELVTISNSYETSLPTPESTGACKFVADNGNPYVECITSDLNVGQKAVMNFEVRVDNPLSEDLEEINNTAYYETLWEDPGLAGTVKEHPETPSNTVTHLIDGKTPHIIASKDADPVSGSTVGKLTDIKYSINVQNVGDADAPYTIVREYIPDYVSYKPNSISDNGVYVEAERPYVEWVLYDLPASGEKTVNYSVTVNVDAPSGAEIRREALFELLNEDPIAPGLYIEDPVEKTNETIHTVITPVMPGAPKIIALKSSNPVNNTPIERTKDIQYSIEVINEGDYTAGQTVVEDIIPEGTTLVSVDAYNGGSNSANLEVLHKEYTKEVNGEDKIRWLINGLEAKDSVILNFTVNIDKETIISMVQNSASYKLIDERNDGLITMDNIDNVELTMYTNEISHPLINPKISVVKSSNPETDHVVGIGSTITYNLFVTNTSTAIANYSNIEDVLPDEVIFIEDSIITDNSSDIVLYNATNNSLQAVLYDLQPNETRTITFKVSVKENVRMGDEIQNSALFDCSITSKGTPGKPDFIKPTSETNEVIHVIEIHTDVLPTGGEGYNDTILAVGIVSIVAGCAYLLFRKKKV